VTAQEFGSDKLSFSMLSPDFRQHLVSEAAEGPAAGGAVLEQRMLAVTTSFAKRGLDKCSRPVILLQTAEACR